MSEGFADLHSHTTASDGSQSPADNVRIASEAGLAAMAVTDHDTVSGLKEAAAAGQRYGVRVVPGVEISTVDRNQDIHMLGYFIDYEDPGFLQRLKELRDARDKRNEMILQRLGELGLPLTMAEVMSEAAASIKRKDDTVGRPHIAAAMVSKGYVASIQEAFDRYLANNGAAYVNPPRIDPETAIRWIHEAGGTPVLAHPGLYGDDDLVNRLASRGLAGLEAYHSDHSAEEERKYSTLADSLGLLVTAGSDFHGFRDGVPFHAALGSKRINAAIIEQLWHRKGMPQ